MAFYISTFCIRPFEFYFIVYQTAVYEAKYYIELKEQGLSTDELFELLQSKIEKDDSTLQAQIEINSVKQMLQVKNVPYKEIPRAHG